MPAGNQERITIEVGVVSTFILNSHSRTQTRLLHALNYTYGYEYTVRLREHVLPLPIVAMKVVLKVSSA